MALKAAAEASAIDPTTGAEWQPVPEIVRLTLKSLHDVVKAQGETIKNLEKTIQTKVGKPEQTSALAEKVDLTELTQTFEDLSRVIDAKADAQETTASLERRVGRSEVQAALQLKADTSEVQRCLDQKATVEEVRQLLEQERSRREAAEARLLEMIEAKASHADVERKAGLEDLSTLVDAKMGAVRAETSGAIQASEQSTGALLRAKTSREDVEGLLAAHAQRVGGVLSAKADMEAVGAALSAKASRAELLEALDARGAELRDELQRLLGERATGKELTAHGAELERRVGELRAEVAAARGELQAHAADVQGWLAAKASAAELQARPDRAEFERQLERRPERAEVAQAHDELSRRHDEARQAAHEAQLEAQQRAAALEGALEGLRSELDAGLRAAATADELHAALQQHPSTAQMDAALEKLGAAAAARAELKADATALQARADELDAKLGAATAEWRAALAAGLEAKVGVDAIDEALAAQLQKAHLHDALAAVDRKANVDDVNRSLLEVNRELSQRPTLGELNRVVGEQSLIMESLCSEHLLGRWIWKSGRTKGEKHLVPWNAQNINTNPDNFQWEKDRCSVTCTAPGLYEVSFGFFTRRKPTVQLLVNGEPVLSAINSASYAVHHSSGRLAAVGPHTSGNVTGLTLLDFLALPPRAKVSCTFQGEDGGEGFLGLRKM